MLILPLKLIGTIRMKYLLAHLEAHTCQMLSTGDQIIGLSQKSNFADLVHVDLDRLCEHLIDLRLRFG